MRRIQPKTLTGDPGLKRKKMKEQKNNTLKKRAPKKIYTPNTSPLEEVEQAELFEWIRANQVKHPELRWVYGSLAGIRLSPPLALKAKKQGNRKGICDICIPCARRGYHGAYIELKRQAGGKLSPEQVEFMAFLESEGYYKSVAKGAAHAKEIIKFYLGIQ